jgi:peptidoglycan/LPS O-acetylase OafA/YrhL
MPPVTVPPNAELAYRPDIDGLRAVAVIAVLVFHALPERLPGGFAGVDIFFVLSGYLISTIILRDLEQGKFSLLFFYSRRVRRIFPSLSLVLATSLVAGWSLLLPGEWQVLTAQVLAGAGFLSNVLMAREAGYFDAAAHTKPLLHLWSLAIEEQFYIFWPLTLLLLWKRVSKILPVILLIVLVSFILDVAFLRHHPAGTFYNPATRMWELLAGAALGSFTLEYGPAKQNATSEVLGAAGALAIAAAFAVLNDKTPFPGWWTLLPVLGAVFLVRAGSGAWFNRCVLSSRLAVFIGLISYPLYLWHWPALVFFKLVSDSDFSLSARRLAILRIAILGFSILLAWATWRFWGKTHARHGQIELRVTSTGSCGNHGIRSPDSGVLCQTRCPKTRLHNRSGSDSCPGRFSFSAHQLHRRGIFHLSRSFARHPLHSAGRRLAYGAILAKD